MELARKYVNGGKNGLDALSSAYNQALPILQKVIDEHTANAGETEPAGVESKLHPTGQDIQANQESPVITADQAVQELKDKFNNVSGQLDISKLEPLGSEWQGHMLEKDAADAFRQMAADFESHFGKPLDITDSYRPLAVQERLKIEKPTLAATPGKSDHGWGFAVDSASNINIFDSPEHQWVAENGPKFGWVNPDWAQPGQQKVEPWHLEYKGQVHEDNLPLQNQ